MGRRVRGTLPQIRHHKPTNSGRVYLGGKTYTVGRYGSAEAEHRYRELLAEHGIELPLEIRIAPEKPQAPPKPVELAPLVEDTPSDITVGEVCRLYLRDIKANMPERRRCGRYEKAKTAARALRPLAMMPAARFGTRALLDVRRRLVSQVASGSGVGSPRPLSRTYINEVVKYVRRLFEWAVLHELVPEDRVMALKVVKPLQPGETKARETKKRKRVRAAVVDATLPYLTSEVAAIVQFIRYTGCRPSEARRMRAGRIRSRDRRAWRYVPRRHKNSHRGKRRDIFIGPKAQQVIGDRLASLEPHEYVFSPRRSLPVRVRADGSTTQASPSPLVGRMFTKDAIRIAIARAVSKANADRQAHGLPLLPNWTPYQLRYLRLHEVRRDGGKEAAQATGGHCTEAMTDHYASPHWHLAEKAAAATG